MKMHDLIEILQDIAPEATVWPMVQPNYPFEHHVGGRLPAKRLGGGGPRG